MAIAFVGAGAQSGTTSTSQTCTLPAHSAGDALLIFVYHWTDGYDVSAPGWEVLARRDAYGAFTPDPGELVVLGKIAGASEADPTVTTSAQAGGWWVQAVAYSGVDASLIARGMVSEPQSASTSHTLDPQIVTTTGAVQVAICAAHANAAVTVGTAQGFTERMGGASYASATGNGAGFCLADKTVSAPDQTQPTFSVASSQVAFVATLALLPDGTTPTSPVFIGNLGYMVPRVGTEITVPIGTPAIQADDLLVVYSFITDGTPLTASAGWTELFEMETVINHTYQAFYKVADGAETQVVLTTGGLTTAGAFLEVYRYLDTGSPFDATPVESTSAGSVSTFTPTGVTVTDGAALVVATALYLGGPDYMELNLTDGFYANTIGSRWAYQGEATYVVGTAQQIPGSAGAVAAPEFTLINSVADDWYGVAFALAPATTVPSAPANPAAVALSDTSIRVTWDDVADETGFRVERSPDGVGSWADVSGNLAAGTTLYDDTGLTAETQYFYRVIAFNASGDSAPSSTVNATTSAASGNRIGGTGAIRKPPRYGG